MKRLLFLFAFSTLLLASCNEDDENENPPGNGDLMQPTSGSITATINGESFNSTNNVARELSYGAFMIRTEVEGKSLKFVLDEFIGNSNYSLSETTSENYAEYFTEINGEIVGFRSISGELVISDYNQETQTFSVGFNITFARVGNNSITMEGEGNYSALSTFEMTPPEIGGTTIFYNEHEFFNLEDLVLRYEDGGMNVIFADITGSSVNFETVIADGNTNEIVFRIGNEIVDFSDGEIILYEVDTTGRTISGHLKNVNSNIDLEIQFRNITYLQSEGNILLNIELTLDGIQIYFEEGKLYEVITEDDPNEYYYSFVAGDGIESFSFFMFSDTPTFQGINQTVMGRSSYSSDMNPDLEFSVVPSNMEISMGVVPNTADAIISIEGIGTLEANSVPIQR